ncbi:HD domain-containing protein [Streptobacillus felis]|uniref:Phosphohydrolase n=1 Tax=Streptobacillus felis TaxID=1384509 RepID=A0A7Z0PE69_9FUSO|nr:HD domain-containing protein [Streptobacillus felis]NYV27537.1 phosphohydrolase [Streptobacillus felis]
MIRKFYEYFIQKIDEVEMKNIISILNEVERKIFLSQSKYDKLHSLNVYKGVLKLGLPKIYLKLALLHDNGKDGATFLTRVLHKLGFKTKLREHMEIGSERLSVLDDELSKLILIHHDKDVDENMKKFQGVDDAN